MDLLLGNDNSKSGNLDLYSKGSGMGLRLSSRNGLRGRLLGGLSHDENTHSKLCTFDLYFRKVDARPASWLISTVYDVTKQE